MVFDRGWLQEMRQFDGGAMSVTRSTAQGSNGQIASLHMPNGLGPHYDYDRARRLTRVQVGTLSQVEYRYDAAGRVTAIQWSPQP